MAKNNTSKKTTAAAPRTVDLRFSLHRITTIDDASAEALRSSAPLFTMDGVTVYSFDSSRGTAADSGVSAVVPQLVGLARGRWYALVPLQ